MFVIKERLITPDQLGLPFIVGHLTRVTLKKTMFLTVLSKTGLRQS